MILSSVPSNGQRPLIFVAYSSMYLCVVADLYEYANLYNSINSMIHPVIVLAVVVVVQL